MTSSNACEWDMLLEIRVPQEKDALAQLLTAIGNAGGYIGDLKTLSVGPTHSIRHITVSLKDFEHQKIVEDAIKSQTSSELLVVHDIVFEKHLGGKIHSKRREHVHNETELRYIYTPGVARVCTAIHNDIDKAKLYTNISNSVGIFTNGTRILGLGDIGPVAGMPVMEGKAVLYDQFAGISATPILVNTKDPEEFIKAVELIAPTFGGIHLEDISTPQCYQIEDELIKRLNKPVMHDDQHGTATVTLAAILSAMRIIGRENDKSMKIAQIGLGAAGFGIARLLIDYGMHVSGVDLNEDSRKRLIAYGGDVTSLDEAMKISDIVITTTGIQGLIKKEMIKPGQIILSLSNPNAEIEPEDALAAGAALAANGQMINNALAYPNLFKAALELNANQISAAMKIAAAETISSLAAPGNLVPSIFNTEVHAQVLNAVKEAILKERAK